MKYFKGLKVVELASVLAGPAVGMFFAELGAQVIKVENRKTGGDMTRHWKVGTEDPKNSISAYFSAVNYHKIYTDLDLTQEADCAKLFTFLSDADVFLNNMKASSAKKFGLDYESLKQRFPKLIHCELSGFKHDERKVAFDAVLQAETGFLSINGTKEYPAKLPIAFIDLIAGHQMKEAILVALLERSKDGKGAHISCSLEESALATLTNQATNQLMAGIEPSPMGTLHPNIAPYGEIIKTSDGVRFMLAIGTDKHFIHLCEILKRNDLPAEKEYLDNPARVQHRNTLHEELKKASLLIDSKTLEDACINGSVPVGRIRQISEVMNTRVAKEMLREEVIEGEATKRLSSIAFHITR